MNDRRTQPRRLRVLISAYACEPGQGSESGIGWNMAVGLAAHHDTWVLTRANNRAVIEQALSERPVSGLRFIYYDLPRKWTRWKRGSRGVRTYYTLWQWGSIRVLREAARQHDVDLVHHLTLGKYWAVSGAGFVDRPFVWGFVGGGDYTPMSFLRKAGWYGALYEAVREVARALSERNPLLRRMARRSVVAIADTVRTAERLAAIGAQRAELVPLVGVSADEISFTQHLSRDSRNAEFIFVGTLIFWKGLQWALEAFAEARQPGWRLRIIGQGPERSRLEARCRKLGIENQVTFAGVIPREEVMQHMAAAAALVHPSLHDTGGFVCAEAMLVKTPVICLALAGPGMQVTTDTGYPIPATDPKQVVQDIAEAMRCIVARPEQHRAMGERARARAIRELHWQHKIDRFRDFYESAAQAAPTSIVQK